MHTAGGHLTAVGGLGLQLVLLALLTVGTGLGIGGWLAGGGYGLAVCTVLTLALRDGRGPLGPANQVTLVRATLTGCVTALVVDALGAPAASAATVPLVALATVALVLDAVDGKVARSTGTASPLGARFDMEVDAFLILVLSLQVATSLGGWVLAIGVMRYAFLAAGLVLPWLRAPLPPRTGRKVVAAVQGIILVAAASEVFPRPVALAGTVLALAALTWSFGRDLGWLVRDRARTAAGCNRSRARSRL
ncbi:CDP-alcohol phosphatidyltransferase family protein [Amycolatopsis cihanbeyliensis]|uniref:CDP-alcohol phosphatidyltransferase-like enzyme n=1 Tax=Amycolatopsis cihanbeyliensis TaxID=1128664 RepID=A0A542CS92_AMYCI|nr:CDP-alcohol phosphatidyltransferase family protein [Amycolatopsis cihanbeyliensis]TQI93694.1 CDP-alcohol phosphatidyltransferase-like enzyme [Amycolatopsis cihanbeyliensis]